ncbi:unnamed protein product [Caenorhabditis angaria]|uniref:Uncharacterized protein n=1 Tax=Caenorhabditis angaria TaxID=860376 RepID=A0A9P1IQI6_9PELO|nr:unnamed protein product [Caenorhabditis angaria]
MSMNGVSSSAVRGTRPITTTELTQIYHHFFGANPEKEYDSDDSILSEIDQMDDEELADRTEQFKKNIENVEKNQESMKKIDEILAMRKKPKSSSRIDVSETPEKTPVRVLKPNIPRQKSGTSRIDTSPPRKLKQVQQPEITKVYPQIARKYQRNVGVDEEECGSGSGKPAAVPEVKKFKSIDTWLGREAPPVINQKLEFFDEVTRALRSGNERYLRNSQLRNILKVLTELTENYSTKENQKRPINHIKVLKMISPEELEEKLDPLDLVFWCPMPSKAEYILKIVRKMFKNEVIDEILSDEKYGFLLKTKDCVNAIRRYYLLDRPEKDNGKSISCLTIQSVEFIRACHTVKAELKPNYKPNAFVDRCLMLECKRK